MRLTCSSLSLMSAPPDEAIRTIGELGFPALDLVGIPTLPPPHLDVVTRDPAELTKLARLVEDAGLEVATVVALPTDGMEHWDVEEIDARVAWAVRACGPLACGLVVIDAGNPPVSEGVDRPAAIARWKAMVDNAFELTSSAGVSLAVEAPHTGTLAERYDEVQELLAALDIPEVGIDYDTSHVHRSGTSTDESLELVGDRIVKVALRDVDADGEFCTPGTGLVDFNHVLRALSERGYAGDLVIELETPGIEDVAGQKREIERARAYIEEILASL